MSVTAPDTQQSSAAAGIVAVAVGLFLLLRTVNHDATGRTLPDRILGQAGGSSSSASSGSATVAGNGFAGNMLTGVGSQIAGALGYVDPFARATGVVKGRTDMGVDVSAKPGSPIVALGDSIVTGIYPNWYKGQPLVTFKLTSGPEAGKSYYYAEQFTPQVRVGQRVAAGQQVGVYAQTGTATEIGWASGKGSQTLAQATTGYSEGQVTTAGQAMAALLGKLGL